MGQLFHSRRAGHSGGGCAVSPELRPAVGRGAFQPRTYKSGLIRQSASLKSAAYSSAGIERLEYLQASTKSARSSIQSALVTSQASVLPELVVSSRRAPGFGRAGTWISLMNLTEPLSMG